MIKKMLTTAPGNSLLETFFNSREKRFYSPARWLWGHGVTRQLAPVAAEFECPLLVVDSSLAGHPIVSALRQRVTFIHEFQLTGYPATQSAIELAASLNNIDGVVAIGGGSAIDLAKASLAHYLYGDLDGVGLRHRRGEAPLKGVMRPPLVAVPTTCGSGAEASRYYVTYDRHTRAKVHGKTWQVVSDWIFSDPVFLSTAPARLVIETAFDAFVHFWETYFCRHEASWLSRQLSLHGMGTILRALPAALGHFDAPARDAALEELSYAATLGGVAISNVRTGNIHEAAGALFELTELSHGQTLFVFFASAIAQYSECIAGNPELVALIDNSLGRAGSPERTLVAWWQKHFADTGLTQQISESLRRLDQSTAPDRIVSRVCDDLVWCQKESPVRLEERAVREMVDASLASFCR